MSAIQYLQQAQANILESNFKLGDLQAVQFAELHNDIQSISLQVFEIKAENSSLLIEIGALRNIINILESTSISNFSLPVMNSMPNL